jgi:large subunit ribosomal protein L23
MDARDIILRPVITEKATTAMAENKYVFKVRLDANKTQIKDAIEKIFNVTVTKVNTIRVSGKVKRMGRYIGQRSDYKKAVVQLKEGDTIKVFEGL